MLEGAVIGLLYAVPAVIASYQVSCALAGIGMSTGGWQQAFAVIGAILAGITAFSRLALSVPPSDRRVPTGDPAHSPIERRPHGQKR